MQESPGFPAAMARGRELPRWAQRESPCAPPAPLGAWMRPGRMHSSEPQRAHLPGVLGGSPSVVGTSLPPDAVTTGPPPVPKRVLGFCRTGCGLLLVTMTLSTVVSMPWTLSSASAPRRTSRPPPLHCWTTAFASWTSRPLANAFSPRKLHRGCKTIPLVSQSELLSPSRCGRGAPGDFPLERRPVLPHNEASALGIGGRRTWPPFWSWKQVRVPQAVSVTDC